MKEGSKMKKGKVLEINRSEEKGTIKKPIEYGEFEVDLGLKGDAHAGNWHRQVSLLGKESFEKMKEMGAGDLDYGVFAENITTEGIILYELPVGTRLRIGETIQEVAQIGKKCHDGCEISKIVGKCIMPKEGIFTKIIEPGIVKKGDIIEVLE